MRLFISFSFLKSTAPSSSVTIFWQYYQLSSEKVQFSSYLYWGAKTWTVFTSIVLLYTRRNTGSPSSKFRMLRIAARCVTFEIRIRICMGKKPIVSLNYENERISIKNSLPYVKFALRLSCVVHGPIYGRFMGCIDCSHSSTKQNSYPDIINVHFLRVNRFRFLTSLIFYYLHFYLNIF